MQDMRVVSFNIVGHGPGSKESVQGPGRCPSALPQPSPVGPPEQAAGVLGSPAGIGRPIADNRRSCTFKVARLSAARPISPGASSPSRQPRDLTQRWPGGVAGVSPASPRRSERNRRVYAQVVRSQIRICRQTLCATARTPPNWESSPPQQYRAATRLAPVGDRLLPRPVRAQRPGQIPRKDVPPPAASPRTPPCGRLSRVNDLPERWPQPRAVAAFAPRIRWRRPGRIFFEHVALGRSAECPGPWSAHNDMPEPKATRLFEQRRPLHHRSRRELDCVGKQIGDYLGQSGFRVAVRSADRRILDRGAATQSTPRIVGRSRGLASIVPAGLRDPRRPVTFEPA